MNAHMLVGQAAVAVVQVTALALGAPVLVGVMRKVRARLEGRVGQPVLQPLLDLRKLFRKERMRPDQASWIFPLAPVLLMATVTVSGAMVPLVTTKPALAGSSDLFTLVYLLLIGSTVLALAGLDSATAFGGMGASRAVTIGALAEPALLVTILALSFGAHSSNLTAIVQATVLHPGILATPQRLFSLGALVVVIVAESGRLPVDNPATHLELTMIHEAMILEYAGPDLALVTVGEAMRLALLLGVLVNIFVPWGIGSSDALPAIALGLVALAVKVTLVAVGLAVFEVFTAKMRLFRLPELLAGAFVLGVLAVVSGLVVR